MTKRAAELCLAVALVFSVAPCATATTIRVPGDALTIQEGIDLAAEGDTVLVTPGTYTGDLNHRLDFGGTNICLISEAGAEVTVIDCQSSGYGIRLQSGEDSASVIQGFTIRNGYGVGYGAGIWCNGTSPTIRQCIIEDCYAWQVGGGLAVSDAATILVEDVVFRGNGTYSIGGGASFASVAGVNLVRCAFENNYAIPPAGGIGGGLACSDSAIEMTDCRFVSNAASTAGSGAWIIRCEATLVRCYFEGNMHNPPYGTGYGGGLYLARCSGEMTSCTFVGDKAYAGGGAYIWSSPEPYLVVGCTFVGCGAGIGGGLLAEGPAVVMLDRCIIAFTQYSDAVQCEGEGTFVITCSDLYGSEGYDWPACVQGQLGTSGNVSADPLFCDLELLDLTLHSNSPCAPGASPECGLIGAWDVGCAATPVVSTSWSALKAMFD